MDYTSKQSVKPNRNTLFSQCHVTNITMCYYNIFFICRSVSRSPLVAEPCVSQGVDVEGIQGFLILMSNGLCKTLEDATGTEHVNKDIAVLVAESFTDQSTLNSVAQSVVDKIVRKHHDTFMSTSERKEMCKKRKDMTLLVRNFNYPLPRSLSADAQSPAVFTAGLTEHVQTLQETLQSINISTFGDYSTNQIEDDQMLFMCQQTGSKKLELNEDGRCTPYADFTNFHNTINSLSVTERELYNKNSELKPVEPDVILEDPNEDESNASSSPTCESLN